MSIRPDEYIRIDRSKRLGDEASTGHNRWHPGIKPVLDIEPGQVVGIETRDAFDGQFRGSTTAAEVGRCNLNLIHPLTGPVYVKGAEPGDILEVNILEVVPEPFGFTVQVPGFGFLRDIFTAPHIIRWDIANGYATSADLPGVRVPGAPKNMATLAAHLRTKLGQREQAIRDLRELILYTSDPAQRDKLIKKAAGIKSGSPAWVGTTADSDA